MNRQHDIYLRKSDLCKTGNKQTALKSMENKEES